MYTMYVYMYCIVGIFHECKFCEMCESNLRESRFQFQFCECINRCLLIARDTCMCMLEIYIFVTPI